MQRKGRHPLEVEAGQRESCRITSATDETPEVVTPATTAFTEDRTRAIPIVTHHSDACRSPRNSIEALFMHPEKSRRGSSLQRVSVFGLSSAIPMNEHPPSLCGPDTGNVYHTLCSRLCESDPGPVNEIFV